MASINLKAVDEIKNCNFFIPDYQRGYRWGQEQITDLLEDLKEFYKDSYLQNKSGKEIYCIQPLVVQKDKNNGKWNVIDGQQRLTTVFIVLLCLSKETLYSIEYETRIGSDNFLESLNEDSTDNYKNNADYYHMHNAYNTVSEWNNNNKDLDTAEFIKMIKERVNFIWYELDTTEDPIKVFTRLNIGKISLTESELIKALFLNRNNFTVKTEEKEKLLTLVEIANEWDKIEYRLQDDRFWLFFHEPEYECPTRIDFILNLIRLTDPEAANRYTNKSHPTFSYFYDKVKSSTDKHKEVSKLWKEIFNIYSTIEEWYNNEDIYHYIGYLSSLKTKSTEVLIIDFLNKYQECNSNKTKFVENLKKDIKKGIKSIANLDLVYETKDSNGKMKSKTQARSLLLLHNVQTIIDQNLSISEEKKYALPDFYRFPFHLFKKEKWDVEHIRPNNPQDFQGDRKKNEIKKYIFVLNNSNDNAIKSALNDYNNSEQDADAFDSLWEIVNNQSTNNELTDAQKNKIWNYVLLDASTNREYGNSCFSIKRDYVLKKENGIKPKLTIENDEVKLTLQQETAFVPICTRKVFSKEYTQYPDNLSYWTEKDAAYYRMDIERTLWWYLSDNKLDKDSFNNDLFKEYSDTIILNKEYDKSYSDFLKERKQVEQDNTVGGLDNEPNAQ